MTNRAHAQDRADAIRVFQEEAARLETEGILDLSEDQKAALAAHHRAILSGYQRAFDIDPGVEAKQLSAGMRVASLLGAIALSASVFFLFYQIWGRLPTAGQVAILFAAPVVTLLATMWIHRRDTSGYFTNLAALVTFVCFVLDLSMLGQIFSLPPDDGAFLVWGALAFVLAYTCDLRLLLVAGIVCVVLFTAASITSWSGSSWIAFGNRPENFIVAGALLLAIPFVLEHDRRPSFPAQYRVWGLLAVFVPILFLSITGEQSYLGAAPKVVKGFYQVLSFVAAGAAMYAGVRNRWPEVVNVGVAFFAIYLFARIADWWWEVMPKWLFFFVIALILLLALVVLRRLRLVEVSTLAERPA